LGAVSGLLTGAGVACGSTGAAAGGGTVVSGARVVAATSGRGRGNGAFCGFTAGVCGFTAGALAMCAFGTLRGGVKFASES
jgi:hypothetical protein